MRAFAHARAPAAVVCSALRGHTILAEEEDRVINSGQLNRRRSRSSEDLMERVWVVVLVGCQVGRLGSQCGHISRTGERRVRVFCAPEALPSQANITSIHFFTANENTKGLEIVAPHQSFHCSISANVLNSPTLDINVPQLPILSGQVLQSSQKVIYEIVNPQMKSEKLPTKAVRIA